MGILSEITALDRSGIVKSTAELLKKREREDNVFRIVPRAIRAESLHSDVLHWLLKPDPDETRGLGGRFSATLLTRWIERSANGRPAPNLQRDATIHVRHVAREASTGRGPIDILLRGEWGTQPFVRARD